MNRRRYSSVSVSPQDGGFILALDGKPLLTPGRRPLVVPALPLAEELGDEWRNQGESIRPETMPINQLVNTAIDRVAPERTRIIDSLLAYGGTDLLCYRVAAPRDLAERQEAVWQPLLDWLAVRWQAEMLVTTELAHRPQPALTITRLRAAIEPYDPWQLTALQSAVAAMGSLALGLALVEGKIDAGAAYQAAQLEELYQAELWGEDEEAADRRSGLASQVAAAARLLCLCRLC